MKKQNITDLANFIEEDLGRGDVTSESLVPETCEAHGTVCAAEPGILAGLEEATLLAASVSLEITTCLLYTSPSPRDGLLARMPSSA